MDKELSPLKEVNGKKVFGINSSAISNESKNLGREFLKSMQEKGFFEGKRYGQGLTQVLTHGEAHSLMRAWKKTGGNLGDEVVIYVDRLTCGICQTGFPMLKEFLNLKKIKIISKDGSEFIF
ncbi:deaminase [Paenibacillus sp. FSL L8-0340]|uniref:deaminase n=1 Tax=Paenibacillus sp. FSL L8-0340 TaxID=2954685 RepID=UPI003158D8EB